MILKLRSLVTVSLLVILSSGIVSSFDTPLTSEFYEKQDYVPYYPDKNHMDYEKPNLFISGIMQDSSNANYNDKELRDFADQNGAIYIPTYNNGIASDLLAVNDAAKSKATDQNGLTQSELKDKEYGTVIGYSGGTTTVVTAMVEQNVKADTLILISPIMGGSDMPGETFDWKAEFEQNLQTILSRGTKIVIIQSNDDVLPVISQAQYKIPESASSMSSWLNDIEVHNVELDRSGTNGHIDMFYSYAIKNIKGGEYIEPKTKTGLPLKKEFLAKLGLGTPMISSASDVSWSSDQTNDGSDTSEKSGTLVTDKASDVWYVDALSWSGDKSKLSKPAAPLHFASGEENTYGYNWIYLPYERTGITYSQGYADWAQETLAAMGIITGAGVGPIVNEDSNGGGGW